MSEYELQALTAIREHMAATVELLDRLLDVPRGSDAPEDSTKGFEAVK